MEIENVDTFQYVLEIIISIIFIIVIIMYILLKHLERKMNKSIWEIKAMKLQRELERMKEDIDSDT